MAPRSPERAIRTVPLILVAAVTLGAGRPSLAQTPAWQDPWSNAQGPVEAAPTPRPGSVWVPGMAVWDGRRYHWVPGHWEQRSGSRLWRAAHWETRGGSQVWVPGQWVEAGHAAPQAPPQQPSAVESPRPPSPPPPEERRSSGEPSASKGDAGHFGATWSDPWSGSHGGQGGTGAAPESESAERKAIEQKLEQHLVRARGYIAHNDPDSASAELDAAESLGGETSDLREAVSSTPTARRREAERKREEAKAQKVAAKEQALANARRARVRVPVLVHAVLDGEIDPLQKALVASAMLKAHLQWPMKPDAEDVVAVLQWGEGGLSDAARARGLTVDAVKAFAANVFGPGLYCRMTASMAGDAPIGKALARLRAAGSYSYMASWTKKQVEAEIQTLAVAFAASIGESSDEAYELSLGMLKTVIPPLIGFSS